MTNLTLERNKRINLADLDHELRENILELARNHEQEANFLSESFLKKYEVTANPTDLRTWLEAEGALPDTLDNHKENLKLLIWIIVWTL